VVWVTVKKNEISSTWSHVFVMTTSQSKNSSLDFDGLLSTY